MPSKPDKTKTPAPADAGARSSHEDLRRRLDEGARAAGVGVSNPMFAYPMAGMSAIPPPAHGAPWMMPPPQPGPASPSMGHGYGPGAPALPSDHGAGAAMPQTFAGQPGPMAGALGGVGNLVQTLVGILAIGVAGGRQVLDALNTGHGGECGGHSCNCAAPAQPCGCCGAANCGAYPPYTGSCSMTSQRGCPSSVRVG